MSVGIFNKEGRQSIIINADAQKHDIPPAGNAIYGFLNDEGQPFFTWGKLSETPQTRVVSVVTDESGNLHADYIDGHVPDGNGGWIEPVITPGTILTIPVLVSYTDPRIETGELVSVNVDFLVPGSELSEKQVLTHFAPDVPVTQSFHAPFVDMDGRLVFNQGFNVENGSAGFGMRFPNPVLYYLREEMVNNMLEKSGLPFRVELYSQRPNQDMQKGDVEFIVFQAAETAV